MYKIPKPRRTSIAINDSVEGETIETKMERLLANKDETAEVKELIFTREQDGVIGAFNIRYDHWDAAYEDATTMAEKRTELDAARLEKRKEILKRKEEEDKEMREQAKQAIKNRQNPENPEV